MAARLWQTALPMDGGNSGHDLMGNSSGLHRAAQLLCLEFVLRLFFTLPVIITPLISFPFPASQ